MYNVPRLFRRVLTLDRFSPHPHNIYTATFIWLVLWGQQNELSVRGNIRVFAQRCGPCALPVLSH